ncbi:protein sym-1-like protein [Carex littledalei]|uniref:Protein sym-1-like protein n=1 Tax=Carex littledalei TaxID=544730 RepID=A0A833QQ75_9POAL|nr:protein sym-1-like protein [Carex littledalei]
MASILSKLPVTAMESLRLPPKVIQFRPSSFRLRPAPLRKCLPEMQFSPSSRFNFSNASLSSGSDNRGLRNLNVVRFGALSDGASGGGGSGTSGGGGGAGGSGGGGGGGEESGNDESFFSWYLSALDKYPIITKAITSAILTLIGDLICQFVIDKVAKLDLKRTFVFTFLGLALVGPTLHVWYLYLSKLVTMQGASGAVARLCLDQFLFSPVFIGVFMGLLITLEGKPSLVMPKLKQEWFPSVIANWQLWVPFQFLNFYFVPQKFQVLAANFVALAWNVILSFKAHKEVIIK